MFNDDLGSRKTVEGNDCLVSHADSFGCLLYGPYEWAEPGSYRVEFDLAIGAPATDADRPSALIDVVTAYGTIVLGSRPLMAGELTGGLRSFSIEITLLEYRQLEYRVHTTGNGSIVVAGARLIRVADLPDTPAIDVSLTSEDPFMLSHQVRKILRLLKPQRAIDQKKVRLGNYADGGYICLDDFSGIDVGLSFGINDDISWDLDAADRGLTIYQFDHTVEDPAPDDDRFVFVKKMISPNRGDDRETIADLVRAHDKGEKRPNIFLKMDIENAEWAAVLATEKAQLSRFSQIVCELHYFQGLSDPKVRQTIYTALSRLNEDYAVVHIHANNYAGWSDIANVMVPCVLEVTFANRAVYRFIDTDELFPTQLDVSCDRTKPDMYLGSFRY